MEFSPAVEERLAVSKRADAIQEFLKGVLISDATIEFRPGDPKWGAVDGYKSDRRFIRVFPKSGLVKVDNLIPGASDGDYGPDVQLNRLGEWSHKVSSSGVTDELGRCVSDAVAHIDGRRVRPGGGSGTSSHRNAQSREWGRSTLPKSLRFAVLFRDNYTCQYCGRKAPDVVLHVDHRTPASRNGPDALDNLLTACAECNLGKSDRYVT